MEKTQLNFNDDTFETTLPQHPTIKKWVAYYYFQETHSDNFQQAYIYYPHFQNALNVYLGAKVTWDHESRDIIADKNANPTCLLTMNRDKSRIVRMKGKTQKLGIIFQPFGINQFIKNKLGEIATEAVSQFTVFGEPFLETAKNIFQTKDLLQRTKLLDHFLLNIHYPTNEERIEKAIQLIIDNEKGWSAQQIAKKININRKTLLRLFQKHIACPVSTFKSAVQFRKALTQYQEAQRKPKLSDIAYDNAYYDQAHFNHHFREITGLNPQQLFKYLQKKGNQGAYWLYEK